MIIRALLICALLVAIVRQFPPQAAPPQPSAGLPLARAYVWRNVAMGGGGFVDGLVFHPTEKDLLYARTDVGGAYRWNATDQRWVPLTDWLTPAENNLTGIESIALDPRDSSRVYLAAGTYSRNNAAILSSDDQGRSFHVVNVPFKMGGNEDGRCNGERLAVDPNQGAILFFGSRRDGLWKSADHAATWTRVESFTNTGATPAAVSTNTGGRGRRGGGFGNQAVGIVSVIFDAASGRAGAPTPALYAAVSTSGASLFRSDDAGANWQPVARQPIGLRPNHLLRSTDGFLYLSYGSVAGPNNVSNGAVWKYHAQDGAWTDITPEKTADGSRLGWGYGAVAVDARHPAAIMATSIDRWGPHDEVFRSTDGGKSWKGILQDGRMDYSPAPYTRRMTPHWMGSLVINPANADQVWFGTGYGIWCCTNATQTDAGGRANWVFLDQGLEETVPLALISPPVGPHLISGVGDIDGFRHDDVNVSPPEGTFAGPRFASTQDLAFAQAKPRMMVRIGNGGRGAGAHAAVSEDGGKSWQALRNDAPDGYSGQGNLAMAADGSVIVWTPSRSSAFFTSNRGVTWTNCQGLASGAVVVADPVNPARFYSFASRTGRLMASTNAAATFAATAAALPEAPGFGGGGVLSATPGTEGDLWVGTRDSGLYHSTDGGTSFAKLDGVTGVEALGFGKAAPGKIFPAMYLLGTAGQTRGCHRSDDAGRTWALINDSQHQFAGANRPLVIGDPRVYGRVYLTTGGRGVIYGEPAGQPE